MNNIKMVVSFLLLAIPSFALGHYTLPETMTLKGEGVHGDVDLVATRLALSTGAESEIQSPDQLMMQKFTEAFSSQYQTEGVTAASAVYKVKPVLADKKVWIRANSSSGQRTRNLVEKELEKYLGFYKKSCPAETDQCFDEFVHCQFDNNDNEYQSLLDAFVASKPLNQVEKAVSTLVELIDMYSPKTRQLQYSLRGRVNRATCPMSDWSWGWYNLFFIDTTPSSGPDGEFYMVLSTDSYEE